MKGGFRKVPEMGIFRREGKMSDKESYMDKVQDSMQETGKGPGGESMNFSTSGDAVSPKESRPVEAEVDETAVNLEDPEVNVEPKQVISNKVLFVPTEDFDARVNQDDFVFQKDRPVEIARGQANDWVEAGKGWIKELPR